MAKQIQIRGGSKTWVDGFTGASRELTIDITTPTIRVNDAATPGGKGIFYPASTFFGGIMNSVSAAALRTAIGLVIGTAAGNVVTYAGAGVLPAADGSNLTNVPTPAPVPVRQTVLSGPLSGTRPSLFPSTSVSLTLTTQNVSSTVPLIATAANGYGLNGNVDVVGRSTANLSFVGTASNTNFCILTLAAGVLTPSTTTSYTEQYGGSASTASGAYTFDKSQMKMFLGNGSVANQVNAVCIGEFVAGSSTITSTVAYAYRGYDVSPVVSTLPTTATATTVAANIGSSDADVTMVITCTSADGGYSAGQIVDYPYTSPFSGQFSPFQPAVTRTAVTFTTGSSIAWIAINPSSGQGSTLTLAKWSLQVITKRRW